MNFSSVNHSLFLLQGSRTFSSSQASAPAFCSERASLASREHIVAPQVCASGRFQFRQRRIRSNPAISSYVCLMLACSGDLPMVQLRIYREVQTQAQIVSESRWLSYQRANGVKDRALPRCWTSWGFWYLRTKHHNEAGCG